MSIALISYMSITIVALFVMSYVGVRTFHYPEFNTTGWRLGLDKTCFVIGTVIAVAVLSLLWFVSLPIALLGCVHASQATGK